MAIRSTRIREFLELAAGLPVLDVRSPGEYAHARMPGAFSLPLFTDEERAHIGTAYKQESREAAIKIGLIAFGPHMKDMVEQVEDIVRRSGQIHSSETPATVLVHCWRGGMRSSAVAWLLDLYGFRVNLLEGGYKSYRAHVLQILDQPYRFRVIGGYTGSGKTAVLHTLQKSRYPVLDLEAIAGHKGSAFGGLGAPPQPGQEQFENDLAASLIRLTADDPHTELFVEDESQRIGTLNLPGSLYQCIRTSPQLFLDVPFEARLDYLTKDYGIHPTEALINAIVRIKKRLGPLETKTAVGHLIEGNVRDCFGILLRYYDKHYKKAHDDRGADAAPAQVIPCAGVDAGANTRLLIAHLKDIHGVSTPH